MKFSELAKQRQSVRKYAPEKKVEREKIEACLEAARVAPSASNSQPWYFVVLDEPELKQQVAQSTFGKMVSFNHFTMQAPVLVAVITEKSNFKASIGNVLKNKQYNHFDVGMAVENFCLQATELGLGTCILGWFDEGGIKKVLNIPRHKRIDLIVALGYAATETIRPKRRKTLAEIRSYNSYAP